MGGKDYVCKGFPVKLACVVFILGVIFLLVPSFGEGAVIKGSVYDIEFNKLNNAVLSINTTPPQKTVAVNGSYRFFVNSGSYHISAEKYATYGEVDSSAGEDIVVKGDGEYVIDFILFPVIDNRLNETFNVSEVGENLDELKDPLSEGGFARGEFLLAAGLLFLIIGAVLLTRKQKERDDYYEEAVKLLKKEKRMLQKDLRRKMFCSEAKVSLILSELEEKGLIKKVKKGRGNVIIWKK